jgi:predicted nucleotidyltransferase
LKNPGQIRYNIDIEIDIGVFVMDIRKHLPIEIKPEILTEFCRKNHIKKLSFFGSVLREDFGPESDVDILVEFEPDHIPGLFHLAGMEAELSALLNRKADMRTIEDLSPYFRQDVVREAEVCYFVEG